MGLTPRGGSSPLQRIVPRGGLGQRLRWPGLAAVPRRSAGPFKTASQSDAVPAHQALFKSGTKDLGGAVRVPSVRALCEEAVAAALAGGASYADARAVVRRSQLVATKNRRVDQVDDIESEGIGVRVLVDGAWGFACDRRLDETGARDAAERATSFAKAAPGKHERALAPVEPVQGDYRTPREQDPIDIPLGDKIALCLTAEEAVQNSAVKVTTAFVRAMRERKVLVSSEGTAVDQDLVECGGGIEATAADGEISQIRSYPSQHGGSSAGAGWEYVLGLGLEREAPRIGEQAAALLSAPICPAATTTVVLDSDQVALQVHESTGHPTELDRIYGTEAAYAGTSFLHAGDLGSLRYGSELMNITADPTTPGGLGTFGYDDEGIPAARMPIVERGVLTGFLTSRETAAKLGNGGGGSMRADGWSRMPLVRMTNLHLEPGEGTLDDLLADVDDGIYLETNKSWSIDDKRLNFQ
ncbi:MAG: TldD/PmbA family protein, partial [Actinobacteria bacterium]